MTKLSERMPVVIGLRIDQWLQELAQLAERTDQRLEFVDERDRNTAHRQDIRLSQLSEHIDVLMDAERVEAKSGLVGRRLVEEALAICERLDSWLTVRASVRASVTNIRKLLARAITEWPNAQE